MTKAFVAHQDCTDDSCGEEEEDESSGQEEGMTTYFCQSSGADEEFEDVTDRISQDIVTAFFAQAENEDAIDEVAA